MADNPLEVLIPSDAIERKVTELGERISKDYAARTPLLLVGVLKGSFIFLADLSRRISIPHAVDFIALWSYGNATKSTGEVRLIMDLRQAIAGKHVLIVEDIVDTGHTLAYLTHILGARQPASLETCALVHKPSRREVDVRLNYVGFEIPDKWVVGYGLDYADQYRTLPYIGYVEPPGAAGEMGKGKGERPSG
ncbi:MAG: hypoxanthine phosphoribosyltransferase [Gemmatimonadetes bacterium]|nr:hypoxanthine phosphoribosyltransferase [Gemmatimonadota bacterium]MBI2536803.1 hypoxanthine phosphoribosyltransferase [Gemmatimonadota bacterium]